MNTPFLNQVYAKVDFDRKLVFKFFTIFSVFEYALKSTRYKKNISGRVEANWDDFAKDITPLFVITPDSELETSVNYLISNPPKKQIVDENDQLTFERQAHRPAVISDTVWLSLLIRRVRNNLFHGGKYRYDRPRDTKLIQHSLVVLEAWAQCVDDVKFTIESILRNSTK